MAGQFPSGLYSEGNVNFNSSPFTNFYLQNQARKRAKDEALTHYFMDFSKGITPAGMRDTDIQGGWGQKVADWKNFWVQNADAIKNPQKDNYRAYNEYMSRYNDILSDTERSKNAAKGLASLNPVVSDPKKRALLNDATINDIDAAHKSIYDPAYKEIDPSRLDYNNKPFDIDAQNKFNAYIKKGLVFGSNVDTPIVDPKTHTKTITTHFQYDPQALQAAGQRGAALYGQDPVFTDYIDKISDNPVAYDQFNKAYKSVYGHDIDISHPAELAAGYALSQVQTEYDRQRQTGYNPFLGQRSGGSGKISPAQQQVTGLVAAIQNRDENAMRNLAAGWLSGNGKDEYAEIHLIPAAQTGTGKDVVQININHKYDVRGTPKKRPDYIRIDADDPYLYQKLAGISQQFTGSDKKVEESGEQVIGTQQPVIQQPQPKKKQTFGKGGLN